ncbi:MAG: Uma2 family endonuclease [Bacteroidota bacterium]
MFDDKFFVDKLLRQPAAPLILQKVQARLDEEMQKREEFYNIITEDDKAEFINGEIVYQSPVVKEHNDATGLLYLLLRTFVNVAKEGFVGIEKILTKFTRNDYEPDVCYFNPAKARHFKKKQMIFPFPDLAVEVLSESKESLRRDKKIKYDDYEMHGVPEYWMVDPDEKTVEQYVLENGKYRLVLKASEGTIRSVAVEGFVIPIQAIFDEEANLAALRNILLNAPA